MTVLSSEQKRLKKNALSRAYKLRDRKFRDSLLNQFDCYLCNESDSDLIDWHHVIPDDKLFSVSTYGQPHNQWWNEVMKCIPLCVMCHRKLHKNKLCLLKEF